MGIENPVHLLFLAAVALIVLGPKRLPELTRAAGRTIRELREALAETGTPTDSGMGARRASPDPVDIECLPAPAGVGEEQPAITQSERGA
ncbi:MAG TPA: twin-arginine translocase TatA/TatE family subunit [Solirubrobacteraceae bacterium]|nr:twin-arginine translocase TatA/TatE family subunit [Solirubrobacteraceae bacterium]